MILIPLIAAAALTTSALAQYRVPQVTHTDEDGDEYTTPANRGVVRPIWIDIDTVVNPASGVDHSNLVPELIAYRLLEFVSRNAYEAAEVEAKTLVAVAPDRPAAHYNLGCVLALQGKTDAAFAALQTAIDLGWRNVIHTRHDGTLDSLRADLRFAKLIARIEELVEEDRIKPRPLRVGDSTEEIADDLAAHVPAFLARYHVPGASVAVVRDGRTVWSAAYGIEDERTGTPLSENVVFRAEAPARVIASILALRLQERGQWDLDDPISRWLPGLALFSDDSVEEITIRQAMNFTAGIVPVDDQAVVAVPDGGDPHTARAAVPVFSMPAPVTIDEEIDRTLSINPDRVGTKYTVNGGAYLAVGRAIENAVQMPQSAEAGGDTAPVYFFSQLANATIIKKLGMKRTLFLRPQNRFRVATGHTEYGSPYRDPLRPLRPAGPVYTTADDLARLLELLLDPDHRHADVIGVSPSSLREICTSGLGDEQGRGSGFGLGVKVIETDFGRCAEAADVSQGAGSLMRWYPDSGIGVVVLFNSDTGMDAAKRIAHLALGGI